MNQKQKLVLILERSSSNLVTKKDGDEVILEGIFAQFGVVNNNDRIYEETEYLPHLTYLQKKIENKRLLGELDHPEKFDISLTKVSHVIEKLEYDKTKRQLVGRVRLLNTPSGRIAQDLVNSGVPISISSRAAGLVESDKKVKIKRIFTYDLVADPGFENAVLSKINESLGISNDSNLSIYDVSGEYPDFDQQFEKVDTDETKRSGSMPSFVTSEEMNTYSQVLKEEVEKLQKRIGAVESNEDIKQKFQEQTVVIEKMQKYLDYIADEIDKQSDKSGAVDERVTKIIEYANSIATTVDEHIQFTDYLTKKADKHIQYTDYLREEMDNHLDYSDYLKEGMEKLASFADYLAKKNDEAIQYAEHGFAKTNESFTKFDEVNEQLANLASYGTYLSEMQNNTIAYSEYVSEKSQELADFVSFKLNETKTTANPDATPAATSKLDESATPVVTETVDYNNLSDKVDSILNAVKKQKVDESQKNLQNGWILAESWFKNLSESKRAEFLTLEDTKKQKVVRAINEAKSSTEQDILKVWEDSLMPMNVIEEKWLSEAPAEYKALWEGLDEKARGVVISQSKFYRLETPYQIKNFWETRSVKATKTVGTMNESGKTSVDPKVPVMGYTPEYLDRVSKGLDRFSKK